MKIEVIRGDITRFEGDAIVNAANETLRGGGGVDGAIHRAAGPRLLEACMQFPVGNDLSMTTRCPAGGAVVTPGFDLKAKHVIHTVGPRYYRHSPERAADLLAQAHGASLLAAEGHGFKTVAFPAISCGVFAFPIPDAARIAVSVMREKDWNIEAVTFVMFTEETYEAFKAEVG